MRRVRTLYLVFASLLITAGLTATPLIKTAAAFETGATADSSDAATAFLLKFATLCQPGEVMGDETSAAPHPCPLCVAGAVALPPEPADMLGVALSRREGEAVRAYIETRLARRGELIPVGLRAPPRRRA